MASERVKLVVLLAVLACVVNSFFNSDVFKRGASAGFAIKLHEGYACQCRREELRDECRAALSQARVSAELSCLPFFRALFVCRNPLGVNNDERGCSDEVHQLAECFQEHIGPYGFSHEEIWRLLFGKQQPAPKRKPFVDVAREGGVEVKGNREIAGGGTEAGDMIEGAGKKEANLGNEVPERGDRPKVDVEQGPKDGADRGR